MNKIKDVEASIRARLKKIAKETNRLFDTVLLQYFHERFLYRLSISSYRNHFVLKGALLFLIYGMSHSRPTTDIDFLGEDIDNSEQNLLKTVKEIISIPVNDGVRFDSDNVTSEIIKEDAEYQGVRVHCTAYLGKARRKFHFDFGFGDVIVPKSIEMDFPVLLNDSPIPNLFAYSPESAIAEKFEAIVHLGLITSRMKDFYDIYYMAHNHPFTSGILKEAMEATFENRASKLINRKAVFSDEFRLNEIKNQQWKAFLKSKEIMIELTFEDCVRFIEKFIEPIFTICNSKWNIDKEIWEKIKSERNFGGYSA
jgi:predicted nucleotidyltransferase component of viral defense system